VLYNQFKYFFNLFFLIIGLTQFYEPLRVGLTFTYIAPLVFVLSLTVLKEFFDDLQRYKKDKEANSYKYKWKHKE
jgi:phospholipid-translocating ATPase